MNSYKVKITKQAKDHLHLLKNYISLELKQPETANRMIRLLKEDIKNLSFMPYRVKCVDEQPWGELGFRKIRVKNYYIYFWIEEESKTVHIISILYSRMDQKRHLNQINIP